MLGLKGGSTFSTKTCFLKKENILKIYPFWIWEIRNNSIFWEITAYLMLFLALIHESWRSMLWLVSLMSCRSANLPLYPAFQERSSKSITNATQEVLQTSWGICHSFFFSLLCSYLMKVPMESLRSHPRDLHCPLDLYSKDEGHLGEKRY